MYSFLFLFHVPFFILYVFFLIGIPKYNFFQVIYARPRKHTGIPKALMVAKLGGEPALHKAIVRDGGKDFYTWRSISVSKTSGTSHETRLSSGNVGLGEENQRQNGNPKAISMDPLKSPSGTSFNFNFDYLRTLHIFSCDCACFCFYFFCLKKYGTSFGLPPISYGPTLLVR